MKSVLCNEGRKDPVVSSRPVPNSSKLLLAARRTRKDDSDGVRHTAAPSSQQCIPVGLHGALLIGGVVLPYNGGGITLQCIAQHSWCDRSTIPSMAGHVPSPHTAAWLHPYPLPSFSVAA